MSWTKDGRRIGSKLAAKYGPSRRMRAATEGGVVHEHVVEDPADYEQSKMDIELHTRGQEGGSPLLDTVEEKDDDVLATANSVQTNVKSQTLDAHFVSVQTNVAGGAGASASSSANATMDQIALETLLQEQEDYFPANDDIPDDLDVLGHHAIDDLRPFGALLWKDQHTGRPISAISNNKSNVVSSAGMNGRANGNASSSSRPTTTSSLRPASALTQLHYQPGSGSFSRPLSAAAPRPVSAMHRPNSAMPSTRPVSALHRPNSGFTTGGGSAFKAGMQTTLTGSSDGGSAEKHQQQVLGSPESAIAGAYCNGNPYLLGRSFGTRTLDALAEEERDTAKVHLGVGNASAEMSAEKSTSVSESLQRTHLKSESIATHLKSNSGDRTNLNNRPLSATSATSAVSSSSNHLFTSSVFPNQQHMLTNRKWYAENHLTSGTREQMNKSSEDLQKTMKEEATRAIDP